MENYNKLKHMNADALFTLGYNAVKRSGTEGEVSLCTAVTDECIGITIGNPVASGAKVSIVPVGVVPFIAQGAVADGDDLVPSGTTNGALATAGAAGGRVVGQALMAVANGEQGLALINCIANKEPATDASNLTLTAGAEAGNAIPVTVAGPAGVRTYVASVADAAMIQEVAAAYTLAETGTGAEVSTTAQARLIFTTDAAGAAEITITDVAGTSTETLYLFVRCISDGGYEEYVSVTFAA